MPQGPEVKRPLTTVLQELSVDKFGLVLAKGRDYFRVEQAAGQARREAKSGHPDVRRYLSAYEFWWDVDPDGKVVIFRDTPSGPEVISAEVGSRSVPLALDEGDWGGEMLLSGSMGKVEACEGVIFERRCYTPGETYSFDDLPSLSRKDALRQTDDFQAHFGHNPEVMNFRLLMIPHAQLMHRLEQQYGTGLKRAMNSEAVRKLALSISREGLKYPPVADEGWKRALAIASLGQDLPYFEILPPFESPFTPWIPSLEGRRWAPEGR